MKYRFFSEEELQCKCCNKNGMQDNFMKKVEALRLACGFPFTVTSAYRCSKHNASVSATGVNGPHTTGRSIDIGVRGEQAMKLVQKAVELGFTGIGVSQKGTGRFIHLDDLTDGYPRPNIWSY